MKVFDSHWQETLLGSIQNDSTMSGAILEDFEFFDRNKLRIAKNMKISFFSRVGWKTENSVWKNFLPDYLN